MTTHYSTIKKEEKICGPKKKRKSVTSRVALQMNLIKNRKKIEIEIL